METEEQVKNIISPLLDGMGLSLVEISIGRQRGDVKVNLVLYKEGGISLDHLTAAQKVLRPRLELEYDRENLSIEISSPGLSRVIKSPQEYSIFTGRQFRLLLDEEWIDCILKEAGDDNILIEIDKKITEIPIHNIRKAKLV
ncbi:MAG: hypothetical protein J7L76_08665 [Spirochaetaceae bacterium]|nr:hypothetical protein [Spirochaetaceae bacterium]RKX74925.1 MAG: hypothetical protein DRP49_05325 [Spirochaetota bacterium]RKX80291.1 MAG: hypothetical protein DRP60_03615 [Spirochaetota bacterium]RKX87295.1 MAG: hypothetical protein DRP70_08770 [Spirochaetota bacterium]RKX99101.1 MAG: hypothetical protein DRZ90_00415 [Spirochaetota bacterium]